jgi:hypothetical protein
LKKSVEVDRVMCEQGEVAVASIAPRVGKTPQQVERHFTLYLQAIQNAAQVARTELKTQLSVAEMYQFLGLGPHWLEYQVRQQVTLQQIQQSMLGQQQRQLSAGGASSGTSAVSIGDIQNALMQLQQNKNASTPPPQSPLPKSPGSQAASAQTQQLDIQKLQAQIQMALQQQQLLQHHGLLGHGLLEQQLKLQQQQQLFTVAQQAAQQQQALAQAQQQLQAQTQAQSAQES